LGTLQGIKRPLDIRHLAHVTRIELEAEKTSPKTVINTALDKLGKMDRMVSFLGQRCIRLSLGHNRFHLPQTHTITATNYI
jgi:hypothetical protein